ncbi:MAG TPA: mannosyltransferase family protein [Agromyces sp.]|nr:mannosyltransferase family protein [Agromyces sp.]
MSAQETAAVREPDPFRRGRRSARVRWRLLPWWARVVLVYAAARAVTTGFVLLLAREQGPNGWTGAQPGYFEFANIWDARWYGFIAAAGYPTDLPLTEDGRVAENQWAFLPVFPGIVRVFTVVGVPWDVASVLVALVAGLGAALVFHRLMSRVLEPDQAMFAVVLFCVAPVAPIMQFGYAESLGFLWLAVALLLLVDRRYGWLVPVVAVWAFTRPGALAFALTLGLHWIVRWTTRRRDPFPVRERVVVASVAAFAGIAGLAWPAIAWAATGEPTAYTDTELAWRSAYIGYVELVPLTPWFQAGDWWLGQPMGTIAPIALVIAFALALWSPWVKRLGVDIRLWLGSYALYLLAVFFPQSSTFRILAPLFPLAGALAVPRSPWWRGGLVVLSLVLQFGWLVIAWRIDGYDWTPP